MDNFLWILAICLGLFALGNMGDGSPVEQRTSTFNTQTGQWEEVVK